jgi:hypothetical protein
MYYYNVHIFYISHIVYTHYSNQNKSHCIYILYDHCLGLCFGFNINCRFYHQNYMFYSRILIDHILCMCFISWNMLIYINIYHRLELDRKVLNYCIKCIIFSFYMSDILRQNLHKLDIYFNVKYIQINIHTYLLLVQDQNKLNLYIWYNLYLNHKPNNQE